METDNSLKDLIKYNDEIDDDIINYTDKIKKLEKEKHIMFSNYFINLFNLEDYLKEYYKNVNNREHLGTLNFMEIILDFDNININEDNITINENCKSFIFNTCDINNLKIYTRKETISFITNMGYFNSNRERLITTKQQYNDCIVAYCRNYKTGINVIILPLKKLNVIL